MPWTTRNEYGIGQYVWVHPKHKTYDAKSELTKAARTVLAHSLISWFDDVVNYYDLERWTFKVDKKKGWKYLPGEVDRNPPEEFVNELGTWRLSLRHATAGSRVPHRAEEVRDELYTVHEAVTRIVMNLIGSAPAGRALAGLRERAGLPKLRKTDIWGGQMLLW